MPSEISDWSVVGSVAGSGFTEEEGEVAVNEEGNRIKDDHDNGGDTQFQEDIVIKDIGARKFGYQHLDDADEVVLEGKVGDTGDGDVAGDAAGAETVFQPLAYCDITRDDEDDGLR